MLAEELNSLLDIVADRFLEAEKKRLAFKKISAWIAEYWDQYKLMSVSIGRFHFSREGLRERVHALYGVRFNNIQNYSSSSILELAKKFPRCFDKAIWRAVRQLPISTDTRVEEIAVQLGKLDERKGQDGG